MERWYWIELIGFDNEKEDFGAVDFLSRNVSTTGVSLLFSHIDFLFNQDKEELLPTACSYGGHEYNRERRRQRWTKTQLRGLVSELKSRGVQVFFSCFDMTNGITDPDRLSINRFGKPDRLVYVLKKGVGEDVIERIRQVIDYYGFDGLQLGDGLSSNRRSIEYGDFSLQLCRESGIKIPEELLCDGESSYISRRDWILKHAKYEWIMYIARLWGEFYDKLFEAIKKPIMFNMAWTRDSFEALYRYGLDYKRCKIDEAFAIMIEENSATRSITAAADEGGVEHPLADRDRFTYEYTLMQQDVKLMTGGLKQISLMPISDTEEQWDALRHCPTELIRATVKRYNNFVYREGRFEVCCNAPHYCLSDGISAEDWRWISKQESYRIPTPDFISGFVAVSNSDSLYREVKHFCEKRRYYGSALLCELVMGGLNLPAQLELKDVPEFDKGKCLVVTNLNVYTDEQKGTLARARIPLLIIGEDVELPMEKSAYYKGKYISAALYGDCRSVDMSDLGRLERSVRRGKVEFGEKWTEPLQYARVKPEFFTELCRRLNSAFNNDRCDGTDVKVSSYDCGDDRYIILSNDRYTYNLPAVKADRPIKEATAIMKDRGYNVRVDGDSFCVRIPPRCVEIVKIK